jgi:hypothetical protein
MFLFAPFTLVARTSFLWFLALQTLLLGRLGRRRRRLGFLCLGFGHCWMFERVGRIGKEGGMIHACIKARMDHSIFLRSRVGSKNS